MPRPAPTLLIDGHIHLHPCFALDRFLDGACANFAAAARRAGVSEFRGVLLFTESAGCDAFAALEAAAEGRPGAGGGWRFERTGEPESLRAHADDGRRVTHVAGRQVATAERLEVHAIGTRAHVPDGLPLGACVDAVRRAGAVPVIPWGAGKWWGRRGALLARFLDEAPADLCLADNGGRPLGWPRPRHFRLAEARNIPVLAGSDPLPFPSEAARAGRFGFALLGELSAERPADDLKTRLRGRALRLRRYGAAESPWRFLRNQLALRLRPPAALRTA